MTSENSTRDSGTTLVELVIAIALMSMLASVISAAVVVTVRTSPAVANRADAAVNVQGLVTWLPQDVDSATPDSFDTSETVESGCPGGDSGRNLLKVTWSETTTSRVDYSASYRYVPQTGGGHIVRVYCIIGAPAQVLKVSGLIPPWVKGSEPVTVILTDSILTGAPPPAPPTDGLVDSAKFIVRPVVGKTIVIDATTKNPNETLTTTTTSEPPPPLPPPNVKPTAPNSSATITSDTPVTINLSASDPEGAALTLLTPAAPAGWAVAAGSALSFVVTAPFTAVGASQTLEYTVTDPAGLWATGQVAITVIGPAPNQPPQANPAAVSTAAGTAIVIALPATDPEGGAMTATFPTVPSGWTANAVGLSATVTPPNNAAPGSYAIMYVVRDPGALTSTSTITVTVAARPCVITPPILSRNSVSLKNNDPDSLTKEVDVTITIVSGYCVGLALHYETGAANAKYTRSFGDVRSTRTVTLPNHPSPELWTSGTKKLDVRDGSTAVIGTINLQVTK